MAKLLFLALAVHALSGLVAAQNNYTLNTVAVSQTGGAGIMFDIEATAAVTINNLELNLSPNRAVSSWDVEVFRVLSGGSHVGHEDDPAAWEMIGSGPVTSLGLDVPTPLPGGFLTATMIAAGTTRGFFVRVSNGYGLRYSVGVTPGETFGGDTCIQAQGGVGKPTGWFDGKTLTPRGFNGKIHYSTAATCSAGPFITNVSTNPNPLIAGGPAFELTVNGFNFATNAQILWGAGLIPLPTTRISSQQLKATNVSAAYISQGTIQELRARNPGGSPSDSNVRYVAAANPVPSLAAATLPAGVLPSPNTITVTCSGTGFNPTSTIVIGPQRVPLPTTFVPGASPQLTTSVIFEQGTAQEIRVVNPTPGGGESSRRVVVLPNPVPTLTSISASSVSIPSGPNTNLTVPAGINTFTLTATGTLFNPSTEVVWGPNRIPLPTTFVSTMVVTAEVDASFVSSATQQEVRVKNPEPVGGESATILYLSAVNAVPVMASMTPLSGLAGSGTFTLTVQGSGFNANSKVIWGGSHELPITSVNQSTIIAEVDGNFILTPTAQNVWVENPSQPVSNGFVFNAPNSVPILSSISPSIVTSGTGTFNVTLVGSGFHGLSEALDWGGAVVPTTYVVGQGGTQLVATFNNINQFTAQYVRVRNPGTGGGLSAQLGIVFENPVPTLASVGRSSGPTGPVVHVTGTGFRGDSVIVFGTTQLTTTAYQSSTSLSAVLPAGLVPPSGVSENVAVFSPGPPPLGGVTSNSLPLVVVAPVPFADEICPSVVMASGPSFLLEVSGWFISPDSVIQINGVSFPTTQTPFGELQTTVPGSLITSIGSLDVTIFTPAPGGGVSNVQSLFVEGPFIAQVLPPVIPIQTPGSPSLPLTLYGHWFAPTAQVFANGDPLPTHWVNEVELTVTLDPATQPATQVNSGIPLVVLNGPMLESNAKVLQIGGSSNKGVIRRVPVDAAPGETITVRIENGAPFQPFLWQVDFNPVGQTSIYPFINAQANFSLNVGVAGSPNNFILLDGIGLFALPDAFAVFDANGVFEVPGVGLPFPALGIDVTLQAIYLDPNSPVGYTMTWARSPDHL